MPDTSGEGFPGNVEVGHEHLHLSTGKIYQYLGGTPSLSSSWVVARGVRAVAQGYTNLTLTPSNLNPYIIVYQYVSKLQNMIWDGAGKFTIQVPGIYHVTHNGQLVATGLAAGQQRYCSIWFRKNGQDILDSPVTNSISGNVSDMRIIRNYRVEEFAIGDTLETYMTVQEAGLGMSLASVTVNGIVSQSAKITLAWVPI